MSTKFHLLFLVLFLVLSSAAAQTWAPIDVNDPRVQELARFAVATHNRDAHENLKLLRVSEALKNTFLYILRLEMLGVADRYEASITDVKARGPELTSFRPIP